MIGRAKSWQARWAPDIAVVMLIAASIAAFHGRYIIAEHFSFDRNDVFDTTLWLAFIIAMLGCGRVVYRLAEHAHRRRQRYKASLRDDDTGSLSVEFLLTFPWMYIMFGMVIQWGLIARAKIVVDYAAYRAARSAITQVETATWGPIYSLNPLGPEELPDFREPRVRETAALILAQISPWSNDVGTSRGLWEDYGYGSSRTPAIAMAEAGNPKWPYAMKTDPYERRAAWALRQLTAGQQGGSGFEVDMELAPLLDFNTSAFGDVAGNALDVLEDMIREYMNVFNGDVSPNQGGSWGFSIPMPWPIPDIDIGVSDGDNSSILTDLLGIPSASDIADQLVGMIIQPARDNIVGPLTDALSSIDDATASADPGNPLIPKQAHVQIRYPYQLRVPLVASLVHPAWETRSGFTGRFIQIEADVSMQTTGGRAGNLLTLLGGTPVP